MKKLSFRLMALMAAMMMTLTSSAKTQDWGGRVIDENGDPMPYVNVVLLSNLIYEGRSGSYHPDEGG